MSGGTQTIIKRAILIFVLSLTLVNVAYFVFNHFSYDIAYGVFIVASVVFPNKAYATVPVVDYVKKIFDIIWKAIQTAWHYIDTNAYPALRDAAAKKLTEYITQQTLNWINNGTEPTFVSDWNQFGRDALDIALDTVNNYLKDFGADLCSPYGIQLELLLKSAYATPFNLKCTVDRFKDNIKRFGNDLVQKGGWDYYVQTFMPTGNFIGMYSIAEDNLFNQYLSQKQSKINEAISSSGFLGQKECKKYKGGESPEDVKNACGDDKECKKIYDQSECAEWEIITPGDVAGKAVANMIAGDSWWATNIQYFASAIVNALITKVFQTGLGKLKGSSVTPGSDYRMEQNPIADSNFEQIKNNFLNTYEDVLYYFETPHTTLQTWKAVLSLAEEGKNSCSSTTQSEWEAKYSQVEIIVNGIQSMIDEAKSNMEEIKAIDPNNMSTEALTKAIMDITNKYNQFSERYRNLLEDIGLTKENGEEKTETEKIGEEELDYLRTVFTPSECGSPFKD